MSQDADRRRETLDRYMTDPWKAEIARRYGAIRESCADDARSALIVFDPRNGAAIFCNEDSIDRRTLASALLISAANAFLKEHESDGEPLLEDAYPGITEKAQEAIRELRGAFPDDLHYSLLIASNIRAMGVQNTAIVGTADVRHFTDIGMVYAMRHALINHRTSQKPEP